MLSGEVVVGIIGVLVTFCVALPGLIVVAWRWRRRKGEPRPQQIEYVSDSEDTSLVPRAPTPPPLPTIHADQGPVYFENGLPSASLRLQTMHMFEMTVMEYPSTTRDVSGSTGS